MSDPSHNMEEKKPNSKKHGASRQHVSFSPSVTARPSTSKVTVVEERGVFVDALGRAISQPTCVAAAGRERVSKSEIPKDHAKEGKGISFASPDNKQEDDKSDIVRNISNNQDAIEYDSLTINLGLLKCGFRYETVVPAHAASAGNGTNSSKCTIVEIGESMDPDLEAEAVPGLYENDEEDIEKEEHVDINTTLQKDHLQIRLAARRPGKYQSNFSIILLLQNHSRSDNTGDAKNMKKHVVSVQIRATLLGKDQGKPQLKADVIKLGKLVGYDSDEETEWQGFQDEREEDFEGDNERNSI